MGNNTSDKDGRVYGRILVPLDGSEAAETILELAKNLAVRSGSALTLLYVCPPEQVGFEKVMSAYIRWAIDLVQRDLSKIRESVKGHSEGMTATVSSVLVRGEPAEEDCVLCREKQGQHDSYGHPRAV